MKISNHISTAAVQKYDGNDITMTNKKTNIRLAKNGGRRVTNTAAPSVSAEELSGSEVLKRKISYQKRQKQRRLQKKRRRLTLSVAAMCVIVLMLLFLTPIFNIRSISINGNQAVTEAQIVEKLKPLIGQNLLRTREGKIEKMLKEFSYIDGVDVQKRLFPPSVEVTVTEYTPAAIVRADGKNLLVNSSLYVLDEAGAASEPLPVITGVEIQSAPIGGVADVGNTYKDSTLKTMLRTLEATGLLGSIAEINISSLTAITMNYDDRITAECGSQLDIEHKIRLFKETVTSDALAYNARGTVDLSEPGKAVYMP